MASVIVFDIRDATKKLDKLNTGLLDMTQMFKNIADLELSQTRLRYRKEEDPDGKKWPDPITIRRDGNGRRSGQFTREQSWNYVLKSNYHAAPPGWHFFDKQRGDKILRDTGTLFNSLGIAYGKDYAMVGTNVEYADKLQNGRFPFLGVNEKTEKNIRSAVTAFVKGLLK